MPLFTIDGVSFEARCDAALFGGGGPIGAVRVIAPAGWTVYPVDNPTPMSTVAYFMLQIVNADSKLYEQDIFRGPALEGFTVSAIGEVVNVEGDANDVCYLYASATS